MENSILPQNYIGIATSSTATAGIFMIALGAINLNPASFFGPYESKSSLSWNFEAPLYGTQSSGGTLTESRDHRHFVILKQFAEKALEGMHSFPLQFNSSFGANVEDLFA